MLPLSLSFLILASQIPYISSPPTQMQPDPAAIHPSDIFPTAVPPTTTTIPAFPEQSAAAAATGSTCPLDLSDDLIAGISASCSPRHHRPASRTRCCPSLAAGLYSASAASILSAAASSFSGNLPLLPDDSESCASAAERAIKARGVELPRVNATCGAAYCYCGIRFRRLSCDFAAADDGEPGKWAPPRKWARKLKKDCTRSGPAGCSLCLTTLNRLKGAAMNVPPKEEKNVAPRVNDCQVMGLTWLLSRNRTRYLPAATAVLRAFMAAEGGEVGPTCPTTHDEMPIAVGSSEIDGDGFPDSSAAGELPPPTLRLLMVRSLPSVMFYFLYFRILDF